MNQKPELTMNEIYHIPAMLRETIHGLNIQPSGLYVDVTMGGGGHTRAILEEMRAGCQEHISGSGKLFSMDQDLDAYENAKRSDNFAVGDKTASLSDQSQGSLLDNWQFIHGNFRYLRNFMDYYGVEQIDGLLADLGVSFHHFDCPERGFSFRFSAPLDMRMNQAGGKTAAEILNTYSEEDIARVLYIYGELNNSRQLAKKIVKARSLKAIERTEELVSGIGYRVSDNGYGELDIPASAKKELAKVFQALRIEVNDEMGALREMLIAARDLLRQGGRIAILTYHSLEDRMVKNFFRSGNLEGKIEKDFYGNILTPFKVIEKGLTASAEEVQRNPRARSAKLRVAEKVEAKSDR